MSRVSLLEQMRMPKKSALEFRYDELKAPPILAIFTPDDINELGRIATSLRYAGNINKKYALIDAIMTKRGFRRSHCGTNRVVYECLFNGDFVAKVALDKVGMTDSPREYINQKYFAPFCCKIFEVSHNGALAFVERVNPISSIDEFLSVADDVFNLLVTKIIGKYAVDDLGSNSYMNFGLRIDSYGHTFGPVIIDFPYVYEIDGAKLICQNLIHTPNGDVPCGGELDYDNGFNKIVCNKCGKVYTAMDLSKEDGSVMLYFGDEDDTEEIKRMQSKMRARIIDRGKVIIDSGHGSKKYLTKEEFDMLDNMDFNNGKKESVVKVVKTYKTKRKNQQTIRDNYYSDLQLKYYEELEKHKEEMLKNNKDVIVKAIKVKDNSNLFKGLPADDNTFSDGMSYGKNVVRKVAKTYVESMDFYTGAKTIEDKEYTMEDVIRDKVNDLEKQTFPEMGIDSAATSSESENDNSEVPQSTDLSTSETTSEEKVLGVVEAIVPDSDNTESSVEEENTDNTEDNDAITNNAFVSAFVNKDHAKFFGKMIIHEDPDTRYAILSEDGTFNDFLNNIGIMIKEDIYKRLKSYIDDKPYLTIDDINSVLSLCLFTSKDFTYLVDYYGINKNAEDEQYSISLNKDFTDVFVDDTKPTYIGDKFEVSENIEYFIDIDEDDGEDIVYNTCPIQKLFQNNDAFNHIIKDIYYSILHKMAKRYNIDIDEYQAKYMNESSYVLRCNPIIYKIFIIPYIGEEVSEDSYIEYDEGDIKVYFKFINDMDLLDSHGAILYTEEDDDDEEEEDNNVTNDNEESEKTSNNSVVSLLFKDKDVNSIETYGSKSFLPKKGKENVIYNCIDDSSIYKYDAKTEKYVLVSGELNNIKKYASSIRKIESFKSIIDFPAVGKPNVLYADMTSGKVYAFNYNSNSQESSYQCVYSIETEIDTKSSDKDNKEEDNTTDTVNEPAVEADEDNTNNEEESSVDENSTDEQQEDTEEDDNEYSEYEKEYEKTSSKKTYKPLKKSKYLNSIDEY